MSYKPLVADCQGACPGEPVEGGVCAARGFAAAGLHAGFRRNPERSDLALVCAEAPVASAGVFTTNRFCAAPVQVDREHLSASGGRTRAIILNSAVANAATGGPGLDNARSTATQLAGLLGCECSEVLVASTGVIGTQLPMEVMAAGMPRVVAALGSDEGHDLDAARAIMTTDTKPKRAAMRYADASGITYTVGGMCKGSGMIAPNMATMLAVVTTDAPVAPAVLDAALHVAADASFNRVTVDGDTSTNDSCFSACLRRRRRRGDRAGRGPALRGVPRGADVGVRRARPSDRRRRRGRHPSGAGERGGRGDPGRRRACGAHRGELAAGQDRHRGP